MFPYFLSLIFQQVTSKSLIFPHLEINVKNKKTVMMLACSTGGKTWMILVFLFITEQLS